MPGEATLPREESQIIEADKLKKKVFSKTLNFIVVMRLKNTQTTSKYQLLIIIRK